MTELPIDADVPRRQAGGAVLFVAGCLLSSVSHADFGRLGSDEPALQNEADYRVIAARCGTPAFEKAFFKQSKAAVAAGMVARNPDSAAIEKAIESRRRNPLQLVSTGADCAEKMSLLKSVQHQRTEAIRAARRQAVR